jgi:hypothetical protein
MRFPIHSGRFSTGVTQDYPSPRGDVNRCVVVPVEYSCALRALVYSYRELLWHKSPTSGANLSSVTRINQPERLTGPHSLVSHHTQKCGPSRICNRLSQRVILQHILSQQLLENETHMRVHHAATCFVQKVSTLICYMLMYSSEAYPLLAAVLGPLLLAGKSTLFQSKLLFALPKSLERLRDGSVRGGEVFIEAEIETGNRSILYRHIGELAADTDKPLAGRIAYYGSGPWHSLEWAMVTQPHVAKSSKPYPLSTRQDAKCRSLRIAERTIAPLTSETRIAGFVASFTHPSEESRKGSIQSEDNVLQHLGVDRAELTLSLLEAWQCRPLPIAAYITPLIPPFVATLRKRRVVKPPE